MKAKVMPGLEWPKCPQESVSHYHLPVDDSTMHICIHIAWPHIRPLEMTVYRGDTVEQACWHMEKESKTNTIHKCWQTFYAYRFDLNWTELLNLLQNINNIK